MDQLDCHKVSADGASVAAERPCVAYHDAFKLNPPPGFSEGEPPCIEAHRPTTPPSPDGIFGDALEDASKVMVVTFQVESLSTTTRVSFRHT